MMGGGRESAMSPKLSTSLSINYKHKSIFGSVNHSFKDDYYFSDSHDMMCKEYALTNFSASRKVCQSIFFAHHIMTIRKVVIILEAMVYRSENRFMLIINR